MKKVKATKTQMEKERPHKKVQKVIKDKGYSSGKLPKDKELHHINPVAEGGKTTTKNTKVVSKGAHKKIHNNRRKPGEI